MLCYKDMVFCPFNENCRSADSCGRALTHEVRKRAHTVGLPISQYMLEPSCFNSIRKKDNNHDK